MEIFVIYRFNDLTNLKSIDCCHEIIDGVYRQTKSDEPKRL